jgi:hypothetical protein
VGAVTAEVERALGGLGAALEWLDDTYEDARQSLIDGAVVSAVLLTSLALLPYVDGGGLIVAFAIIGTVQAVDLAGRTGRDLARRVRRVPPQALRE